MKTKKLYLGNKKTAITKQRLELIILIVLVVSAVAAQVSGLYPYAYSYAKCKDAPLEVRGGYYRLPFDDNYGIHRGSDYSRCYDGSLPKDLQRDPTTQAAIKSAAAKAALKEKEDARIALLSDYIVYKPEGYYISSYRQSDYGDRFETAFTITTSDGIEFNASEMKKDSSFDYTKTCSRSPEGSWSGTIIGVDTQGREICKINPNKYVHNYIVGIYIGNTTISLKTDNASDEQLNAEVTKIFSSMKPARDM